MSRLSAESADLLGLMAATVSESAAIAAPGWGLKTR
jgi:hypothetical protein